MTSNVIQLAAYRKAEPLPEPKQPRKRGRKPKADAPVAPPQAPATIRPYEVAAECERLKDAMAMALVDLIRFVNRMARPSPEQQP